MKGVVRDDGCCKIWRQCENYKGRDEVRRYSGLENVGVGVNVRGLVV